MDLFVACMAEEARRVSGGDAVEGGTECPVQRLGRAGADAAQVGFHLGPSGFDGG